MQLDVEIGNKRYLGELMGAIVKKVNLHFHKSGQVVIEDIRQLQFRQRDITVYVTHDNFLSCRNPKLPARHDN